MSSSLMRSILMLVLTLALVPVGTEQLWAWQDLSPAISTLSVQQDRNQKPNREKSNNSKVDGDPKATKTPPPPISKQRIEELFAFVEQHHSEVKPLLRSLQRKQRAQFQTAMRTLDREVRTLQAQKEKAPERYRRSLELWISRSKTKLIAARIATAKSQQQIKKLEREMEAQINHHFDIRKKQLQADLVAAKKRAERIENQISEIASQRQNEIKRQKDAAARMGQKMNRGSNDKNKANPAKGKAGNDKSANGKAEEKLVTDGLPIPI